MTISVVRASKSLLFLIFPAFSVCVGQQNASQFSLMAAFGPGYLTGDNSLNRIVDHNLNIGVNYLFYRKKASIQFNPALIYQVNKYHAKMQRGMVHVNQWMLQANPCVLLKATKSIYLKAGLLFGGVFHTNIYQSRTDYRGRYYFSNEQMYKGYSAMRLQVGLTAGVVFPFNLFRRQNSFGITGNYIVSRLVDSDFLLPLAVAGEDIRVLSVTARPVFVMAVLEIALRKRREKPTETER